MTDRQVPEGGQKTQKQPILALENTSQPHDGWLATWSHESESGAGDAIWALSESGSV